MKKEDLKVDDVLIEVRESSVFSTTGEEYKISEIHEDGVSLVDKTFKASYFIDFIGLITNFIFKSK